MMHESVLGIQNEINFKKYFDNKKVKDLSKNAQKLIFSIFNNVSLDSEIDCWRSKYLEKSDIKIKINGIVKGISIKSGHRCSMHQENKQRFYDFLTDIGVDNKIISDFDKFMVGKINNVKVDAETYIEQFSQDIDNIRKCFNAYYIRNQLFIRFIFKGIELQKYHCVALIYGTPGNFIWATNSEILEYLNSFPSFSSNFINVGALNIKCYDRNLQNKPSRRCKEDDIQVKWYTLERDLLYLTKIREADEIRNNFIRKNEFSVKEK